MMRFIEFKKTPEGLEFCIYGERVYACQKAVLGFDRSTGVLLFHGTAEMVDAEKARYLAQCRERFAYDMMQDLDIIEVGPEYLDDLNEVVQYGAPTKKFYERWSKSTCHANET